jgi:DNA-binding NtrC family response regulator
MPADPIRVLLIDDSRAEYVLVRAWFAEIGDDRYELEWTDTYEGGLEAVCGKRHDVYLVDYSLGRRSGVELLGEAVAAGCGAPIILLTGQGDHSIDLAAMNAGAADFLVKGRTDAALLERSIRYAIEHKRLVTELQSALAHVKQLQGILPICSYCHKIRDDQNYWQRVEAYVADHSAARFSHGICPDCWQSRVVEEYGMDIPYDGDAPAAGSS